MEGQFEGEAQEPAVRGRHINKRALKNKALAVSFNEKDLRDYVSGFHKRKKKRRKEAQKQQEEALRRKRIEQRKKRKLEREFALYGGARPVPDESDPGEESEPNASVNATTEYDNGDTKVTVRTSEISREDKDLESGITPTPVPPGSTGTEKKHSLGVSKKKSFKTSSRSKPKSHSHSKQHNKDKKKAKKKNKKR